MIRVRKGYKLFFKSFDFCIILLCSIVLYFLIVIIQIDECISDDFNENVSLFILQYKNYFLESFRNTK